MLPPRSSFFVCFIFVFNKRFFYVALAGLKFRPFLSQLLFNAEIIEAFQYRPAECQSLMDFAPADTSIPWIEIVYRTSQCRVAFAGYFQSFMWHLYVLVWQTFVEILQYSGV